MPATIPTPDALYLDWQRRLPSWVFRGLRRVRLPAQSPVLAEPGAVVGFGIAGQAISEGADAVAKDPLFGALADAFGDFHVWFAALMQQASIADATGEWLDLHAADRGTARRSGESDTQLRFRLVTPPHLATEAAIRAAVDAIIAPDACEVYTLRARELAWDSGFYDAPSALSPSLWGATIFERRAPGQAQRELILDDGFWDSDAFGGQGPIHGPLTALSPWAVAVVVVPPQTQDIKAFWDVLYFDSGFWGGTAPHSPRYSSIRQAVESVRAAGIQVLIQIATEGA